MNFQCGLWTNIDKFRVGAVSLAAWTKFCGVSYVAYVFFITWI